MNEYIHKFKRNLQETFKQEYKRPLEVSCELKAMQEKKPGLEYSASKVKGEDEPGFQE